MRGRAPTHSRRSCSRSRYRATSARSGAATTSYALGWPGDSPLRPSYERVRDDPTWTTHELDGKHNLMRDNADDLLRILPRRGHAIKLQTRFS